AIQPWARTDVPQASYPVRQHKINSGDEHQPAAQSKNHQDGHALCSPDKVGNVFFVRQSDGGHKPGRTIIVAISRLVRAATLIRSLDQCHCDRSPKRI
ncbi:hypothetical protein, partial [Mesorhizobium sp. M7A.F.Ca.AU.001.01.1.1]